MAAGEAGVRIVQENEEGATSSSTPRMDAEWDGMELNGKVV